MSIKNKLEIISDLMSQLMSEMEPNHEDMDERLGRKKPMEEMGGGIKSIEIKGKLPMDEEMEEENDDYMEEEDESSMSPLNRLKKLGMK